MLAHHRDTDRLLGPFLPEIYASPAPHPTKDHFREGIDHDASQRLHTSRDHPAMDAEGGHDEISRLRRSFAGEVEPLPQLVHPSDAVIENYVQWARQRDLVVPRRRIILA